MATRKQRAKYEVTPVEAVVHQKDTRTNIRTIELADFVVKEEQAPYKLRYPRDPSLDPRLSGRGRMSRMGKT